MPLNVHLMLSRPDLYIPAFADAGSDTILIHAEAECDVEAELIRIKEEFGIRTGITINPGTPVEIIFPVLGLVDEVLCMSVHPGYGGQSFMPNVLPKLKSLRQELAKQEISSVDIMVDGGINNKTAVECAVAGANLFVAGTWLFAADDMATRITNMRNMTAEI
jgi:ribulose-phosphate 3-epimerase